MMVHVDLVPPEDVGELDQAAYLEMRTEIDVRGALRERGHEVQVIGVGDDLSPLQAIQATEAGVQAIQALYEAAERGRPV